MKDAERRFFVLGIRVFFQSNIKQIEFVKTYLYYADVDVFSA